MALKSINPANGKLLMSLPEENWQVINKKLDRAVRAFRKWRTYPFKKKAVLFRKVASLLKKKKYGYGRLISLEMGKPINQSVPEVEKCAWVCDYYSKYAEKFLTDERVKTDSKKSYIHYQPLGAILAIMPWNFPFWQVFRFAAPALMAGNVAVLKHASNVPQCALEIEKVFMDAGFPIGVFSALLIGSKPVSRIIADDRIAAVTLTGSNEAGEKVAEVAGKNIKKTVLELGGSDPFIVLDTKELDRCCDVAVTARTVNSGQSCIAAKRFIVTKRNRDKFVARFVEKMRSLKVGNPLDETTQVGPLARQDLADQLDRQVKRSIRKGAKSLLGGHKIKGKGAYYQPTVLVNVKKGMPAYDEEIFGPVACIITVADEKQAIKVANDTMYGLGASIWTSNINKGVRLADEIESGMVFINGMVRSDPRLPFGGIKKSGYGREVGIVGIREFTNIKAVVIK